MQVSRYMAPFSQQQLDQRDAGDIHRHVQQEVAAAEQRIEHPAEVLAASAAP